MARRLKGWIRVLVPAVVLALTGRRGSAEAPGLPLRQYVFSSWTVDQGLPQNFIRAIAQTSDGFLWVGTMNGLARFDGVQFRGFSKDGPPELQDNISGLEPDSGGGLWVATATGLFHYRQQQFTAIPLLGETHYRIEAMARGQDGEVWIYANGKLARTQNDVLRTREIPPRMNTLRAMAESVDRTLWMADGESIFALRSGGGAAARYALPGTDMVYEDDFGDVLAGDRHRLFRLEGKTFARVRNAGLGNFVSVLVDSRRQLWMASGGLHGLSRRSDRGIETLTTSDGLASDDVRVVFEDRSHDIWVGTISGLQRLHRGVFTTYSAASVAPGEPNELDAVFEQKDGSLWAGTLEGGAAQWTNGRWRVFGPSSGLPAGQVRGFAEDEKTPAIAVSDYGIFARRKNRFSRLPAIPRGYIDTPVRTADGSLWFGVQRRGLFRLKGTQIFHPGRSDGLPDGAIWFLTADARGVLWVGDGNQLLRWNQGRFDTVLTSSSPILNVVPQPSGGFVLGTLHGRRPATRLPEP